MPPRERSYVVAHTNEVVDCCVRIGLPAVLARANAAELQAAEWERDSGGDLRRVPAVEDESFEVDHEDLRTPRNFEDFRALPITLAAWAREAIFARELRALRWEEWRGKK